MSLPPVVCDNGSGFVKAGFAGDNIPREAFPALVGRLTLRSDADLIKGIEVKDVMVGDECTGPVRSILELNYPISNGIIQDWDDMNTLWDYIFYSKLNVDPKERRVLLTEAAMNPKVNKRRMVETMFERYGFEGVNVQVQAVLTLYAQGLQTGLVVDSGDGVTHIVPVYNAQAIDHCVRRINIAGRDITKKLCELLLHRGYTFNSTADFETVREIKEKFCYVAYDTELENKLALETTAIEEKYKLPDGREIRIGPERFLAPESLFDPSLLDIECKGMSEAIWDSINSCPVDIRSDLYAHIVLSGGSTMYPGLPSRIENDIKKTYLEKVLRGNKDRLANFNLRVEDPARRKHFVYMGASVFANLIADQDMYWIMKADYDEVGSSIIDQY